jgi:hypothetical protein
MLNAMAPSIGSAFEKAQQDSEKAFVSESSVAASMANTLVPVLIPFSSGLRTVNVIANNERVVSESITGNILGNLPGVGVVLTATGAVETRKRVNSLGIEMTEGDTVFSVLDRLKIFPLSIKPQYVAGWADTQYKLQKAGVFPSSPSPVQLGKSLKMNRPATAVEVENYDRLRGIKIRESMRAINADDADLKKKAQDALEAATRAVNKLGEKAVK